MPGGCPSAVVVAAGAELNVFSAGTDLAFFAIIALLRSPIAASAADMPPRGALMVGFGGPKLSAAVRSIDSGATGESTSARLLASSLLWRLVLIRMRLASDPVGATIMSVAIASVRKTSDFIFSMVVSETPPPVRCVYMRIPKKHCLDFLSVGRSRGGCCLSFDWLDLFFGAFFFRFLTLAVYGNTGLGRDNCCRDNRGRCFHDN